MEGELQFKFLGAMNLLRFLTKNRLINRYGYLCRNGAPISHDDMPHFRTRGRKLTIPDSVYPEEFYSLLDNIAWTGWLIVSRPGDEWIELHISKTKYRLNTRQLWNWILETKTYVLHRSIELEEYSTERGANLGHDIAKMLIAHTLVPQVEGEQVTQVIKNRWEISRKLQKLLVSP